MAINAMGLISLIFNRFKDITHIYSKYETLITILKRVTTGGLGEILE